MTLGVHEDLDEAVMIAIEEMIGLIGEKYGVDKPTALALASVLADVRVTQIVNGVKGAHVVWRDDSILA
jgi:acetamidase/formamidase